MTTYTDDEELGRSPTSVLRSYLKKSISVSTILRQIWEGRFVIAAAAVLGLLYGAYAIRKDGAQYIATMRVSPAETDLAGGAGGGGAGGLLAGLTGSTGAPLPKFTQFSLSLGSVGVAELLNKRYDMLCRIYQGQCDLATHKWTESKGWRQSVNSFFAWLGHLPDPNGERTVIDLAAYIGGAVHVDSDKQTAVYTITYSSANAKFAAEFLSKVIATTNDHIKLQNHNVQRRYVDYLTTSAASTANVEQRQAIDNLLLQNERQLMLTEVDVPYAAQIIDGPVVLPVDNVRKVLMLNTLIGLILGVAVAIGRNLVPRRWRFW